MYSASVDTVYKAGAVVASQELSDERACGAVAASYELNSLESGRK